MPIFTVREDTLLKAFIYASVVVGVSTAMTLEYRSVDPFRTYQKAGDGEPRQTSFASILQTALVSCLSTFVVLWSLYFVFGFGKSFMAPEEGVGTGAPGSALGSR